MQNKKMTITVCTFIVSTAILLQFSTTSIAAQNNSIPCGHLIAQLLKNKNIEAGVVPLRRSDGFNRGIYIKVKDREAITIGFSEFSTGEENLYLLDISGNEIIVYTSDNGDTEIVQGTSIDFNYVFCIINSLLTLSSNISICDETGDQICYVKAFLTLVLNIMNCGTPSAT